MLSNEEQLHADLEDVALEEGDSWLVGGPNEPQSPMFRALSAMMEHGISLPEGWCNAGTKDQDGPDSV